MNITEKTIIENMDNKLSRGHIAHCILQKNVKIKYTYFGKRTSSGVIEFDTKAGRKKAKFKEKYGYFEYLKFIKED